MRFKKWFTEHRRTWLVLLAALGLVSGIAYFGPTERISMWFTEDPWPPLMILAVLAIVFGIAWNATRRGMYFVLAFGMVAAGVLVLIAEEMIVTESEEVEARVSALGDAVVDGTPEPILSFFAKGTEGLQSTIANNLKIVDVRPGLRITDMEIQHEPGTNKAE
ncbi:MAG: hypothetical protein KDA84_16370, partial [Planctomycetaceae bacterium]|nr:hypothetical protein [Planctomycetaceae bacterium]